MRCGENACELKNRCGSRRIVIGAVSYRVFRFRVESKLWIVPEVIEVRTDDDVLSCKLRVASRKNRDDVLRRAAVCDSRVCVGRRSREELLQISRRSLTQSKLCVLSGYVRGCGIIAWSSGETAFETIAREVCDIVVNDR